MTDLELLEKIDFDKQGGLVPAIVQDHENGQVLMLAYMSKESLKITIEKGLACYYSRSRKSLWLKGETSDHYQHVCKIDVDCDNDTILLSVIQDGAACHTGARSCFFQTLYQKEEQ
ncbi:phosphoribosyl-AMP cyclohydrolase [Merdibacter massiliensis]|uniref:phosphoribosyl-AMP cyclohydrolase n=1 Tax=Merdibacter massiliensis TaxID=1871030 RepID=UPI00096A3D22